MFSIFIDHTILCALYNMYLMHDHFIKSVLFKSIHIKPSVFYLHIMMLSAFRLPNKVHKLQFT